jgi:hypothetical protein
MAGMPRVPKSIGVSNPDSYPISGTEQRSILPKNGTDSRNRFRAGPIVIAKEI